jgi:hypothetical protein
MNLLALLSLFSKISGFLSTANTVLTESQKLTTTVLHTASAVATATGNTVTAGHLQVISDAVAKDSALADAALHVLQLGSTTVSATVTPVAANSGSDAS